MALPSLKSVSLVVALVGMLSSSPAHAHRTHHATDGLMRLRGGGPAVASPLQQVCLSCNCVRGALSAFPLALAGVFTCYDGQVASAIGQTLGYSSKKDIVDGPTTGPTTGPTSVGLSYKVGLPVSYQPFPVSEGPLAESMRMIATQERSLLVQASRCRVALYRLDMLQKIMASRACSAKEQKEVERWKISAVTTHKQLDKYMGAAGKEFAKILGEKSMTSAGKGSELVTAL